MKRNAQHSLLLNPFPRAPHQEAEGNKTLQGSIGSQVGFDDIAHALASPVDLSPPNRRNQKRV